MLWHRSRHGHAHDVAAGADVHAHCILLEGRRYLIEAPPRVSERAQAIVSCSESDRSEVWGSPQSQEGAPGWPGAWPVPSRMRCGPGTYCRWDVDVRSLKHTEVAAWRTCQQYRCVGTSNTQQPAGQRAKRGGEQKGASVARQDLDPRKGAHRVSQGGPSNDSACSDGQRVCAAESIPIVVQSSTDQ